MHRVLWAPLVGTMWAHAAELLRGVRKLFTGTALFDECLRSTADYAWVFNLPDQ